MERQLVILNPRAGRMQAGRRLGELLPLLESDGVIAELLETKAAGEARAAVASRAGEFRRVVCIGGDGTLNEVLSGMLEAGQNVPIGYIAAGSTNDFAASHGISRDILQAARDIASGVPTPIDVGTLNGRCFAYTASFGAFTRASYAAPQAVKNAVGHLAYIFEGIRGPRQHPPLRRHRGGGGGSALRRVHLRHGGQLHLHGRRAAARPQTDRPARWQV